MTIKQILYMDCCTVNNYLVSLTRFFKKKKVYLFWKRESTSREEAERRDRIPSRLHAVSTETLEGLKLPNGEMMSWAEIKSQDA